MAADRRRYDVVFVGTGRSSSVIVLNNSVVDVELHRGSVLPLVSHFEYTPFSRRLLLAIKLMRKDDVARETGST